MERLEAKKLKGAIYIITFLVMAYGFHFQPTAGIMGDFMRYGVHFDIWAALFVFSSILVGIQTYFKQSWNFLVFAPYFMYASAVFWLWFAGVSSAPLSTVAVHTSLAAVLFSDILLDWREEWERSAS